jgi:hypothetical protein
LDLFGRLVFSSSSLSSSSSVSKPLFPSDEDGEFPLLDTEMLEGKVASPSPPGLYEKLKFY